MGEITHSNDYMEGRWLLDEVLRNALLENELPEIQVSDIIRRIYQVKTHYNAFAFCLSEDPDVLSQWRGYTKDGQGIAIGFNKGYLESLLGSGPNLLSKIKYTKEEQLELIGGDETIKKIKDAIDRGALLEGVNFGTILTGPPTDEEKEKRKKAFADLLKSTFPIALMSFQAKNPAFEEEKEWRLIQHNFIQDQPFRSDDSEYYDPERKDLIVRASANKLTPCIRCELPLNESPLARALSPVIQEVKLGPKNTSDIRTIKYLIAKTKMGIQTKVTKSAASYR